MKFIIESTCLTKQEYEVENAVLELVDRVEKRTLRSVESFDERFSKCEGSWYSIGINHCIGSDNYIQRTHPKESKVWTIEIDSIEDLMKLREDIGEDLIIQKPYYYDLPVLLIHDGCID